MVILIGWILLNLAAFITSPVLLISIVKSYIRYSYISPSSSIVITVIRISWLTFNQPVILLFPPLVSMFWVTYTHSTRRVILSFPMWYLPTIRRYTLWRSILIKLCFWIVLALSLITTIIHSIRVTTISHARYLDRKNILHFFLDRTSYVEAIYIVQLSLLIFLLKRI